jgi:hypothetical protein
MPIDVAVTSSTPSSSSSSPVHVDKEDKEDPEIDGKSRLEPKGMINTRTQELCGLFVGYAFALQ